MIVIILSSILSIINGIMIGYLFFNLKADIISLQLMNKLCHEDKKKYLQDFQLKMTDKVALLDAKLTRVLTEIESSRTKTKEAPCNKIDAKPFRKKNITKKRRGKVPLPFAKQPKIPEESPEVFP